MKPILVELSDPLWTNRAIHLACSMTRASGGTEIVLLYLNSVPHPSYLGSELEMFAPTPAQLDIMSEASATAEDYGFTLTVESMAYATSRLSAVAEAANDLHADIVFVQPIKRHIPLWSNYQWGAFTRAMERGGHQLCTVTQRETAVTAPETVTFA